MGWFISNLEKWTLSGFGRLDERVIWNKGTDFMLPASPSATGVRALVEPLCFVAY
jgi:hypothetical protein